MGRMPQPVSARSSLFLYVRTHAQLERYLCVGDTRRAANQDTMDGGARCRRIGKVVPIDPAERRSPDRHRR